MGGAALAPSLPHGCNYHFFMSKHENIGRDFNFDVKCRATDEAHLRETCREVKPAFQPYARAVISAIECIRWVSQRHHRQASIQQIKDQFRDREDSASKLKAVLNGILFI